MGKKINEKKVKYPRNKNELVTLYIFEKLAKLEDNVDIDDVVSLFANSYDTDIHSSIRKYIVSDIKQQLHELRMQKYGKRVRMLGYTSDDDE